MSYLCCAVNHTMWSPVLVLAVWLGSSEVRSFCLKACCWCPEQQSPPVALHILCSSSLSSSRPEPSSTSSWQTHTSIPESPVTCRRRVTSSSSSSAGINEASAFSASWHCAWLGIDTAASCPDDEAEAWPSASWSASARGCGTEAASGWRNCGGSAGVVSGGFSE